MSFSIIAALDEKLGIGKDNQIPWHLSEDFKYFANTTKTTTEPSHQNAVIMGSNTWLSLPDNYQPLPKRLNVVLNSEGQFSLPESVLLFTSLDDALKNLKLNKTIENIFIIGGGKLYASAINHEECTKLYITKINKTFECDIFFPQIPNIFRLINESDIKEENGLKFQFLIYEKN